MLCANCAWVISPHAWTGAYQNSADMDGANFLKAHGWRRGQGWLPGTPNYAVLRDWNRARVYQRTIAVMADSLRR